MRWFFILFLIFLPTFSIAQEAEDDKGRITKFLEGALSGGGREVVIEGFAGALSSTVTMESMTISDQDGVWLTLENAELNWNRAAILRGDIQVNTLSAEKIVLPRLPKTEPAPTSPETKPFSLPELPVSINIGKIETGSLFIGEDIIGTDATFSIAGSFSLADGAGDADLRINRTDGLEGIFKLVAGFANDTRALNIDLFAKEDTGGIVASLAGLPGEPSVEFAAKGEGELEDFVARIHLKSDDEERLAGFVAVNVVADPNLPTPAPGEPLTDPMRVFSVDLQGDVTPLFAPQYQDFFGENVAVTSVIRAMADGSVRLDQLLLETAHFGVKGDFALNSEKLPERFNLKIRLSSLDGTPVLLPLSGPETWVKDANLIASYNQKMNDRWTLKGRINNFARDGLGFEAGDLKGGGSIQLAEIPSMDALVHLDVLGFDTDNPGLHEAIGNSASFDSRLAWKKDGPLTLHALELKAKGIEASASGEVRGLDSNVEIRGQAHAKIEELSGFSKLAGRELGGGSSVDLSGLFTALTGAFDVTLTANGKDLQIGDPRVDALAKGDSKLFVSAKRDETGVTLRDVSLVSDNLNATANGTLNSENGDLLFKASLADVSPIAPDISGPVTVEGELTQDPTGRRATVDATGPGASALTAQLNDPANGALAINLDAEIGSVSALVPSVPGSATVSADITEEGENWNVLADVLGSNSSNAKVSGTVSQSFDTTDLTISGRLPLALANTSLKPNSIQGDVSFDMAVNGKPSLENVSGTLTTSGAQLVLPSVQFALSDITTSVQLANSNAAVQLSTNGRFGGQIQVNGNVDLNAPLSSNLNIALNRLIFQMGSLLTTTLDGQMNVSGPLTAGPTVAGDIALSSTQIFLSTSALGGAGAVPEVAHRSEPSQVHQTRDFADLIKEEKTSSGGGNSAPVNLDISVRTSERIVVDGLGLHANFEGGLDIVGNSNEIETDGEFDLMRGNLDFLGKRFELTEGLIRLAGSFVPDIRIVAETSSGDTDFEIIVAGSASSPLLEMNSEPELPEEEMLSHLLFGKGVSNISAVQAAQLASAAATLSGGGQRALLRTRDSGGLDDFGLTTDEDGNTGLRAGKYINENIYTDITLDGKGQSTVNLNLDITDSLTVKGSVDSESETGIGIFYRHDY